MLAWVAQGGGGLLIPGSVQDQVRWGSKKPVLEDGVPAHG